MYSIIIGLILSIISFDNQVTNQDTGYAVEFETRLIDLGEVKKGDTRKGSFKFKNIGTEDIIIELVSACECTTTSHSYDPIEPGKTSEISFVFDSSEKEESETIDVDVYLKNIDKETGEPIIEMLQYKYTLIK